MTLRDPDEHDWLEDMVDGSDAAGCTTPKANRSTEFDWGRYPWALATVEDVPISSIWAVMDDADPHDWCAAEIVYENGVATCELATARWEAAMDDPDNAFGGEHDRQAHHGLDH